MIELFSFFNKAQDRISCITHFLGIILGFFYLISLQIVAFIHNQTIFIHLGLLTFALSTIALYSASSYYHYIPDNSVHKTKFRKLDHAMIYVLIAGTYTPLCIAFFKGNSQFIFPIVMWTLAIIGVIAKIIWINAPRLLYTALYLILGWAIIFDVPNLLSIPTEAIFWTVLGGISYSIGAIIYILKKPNISTDWGFHELFHIFILLGTFFHYLTCILTIA